MMELTMKHTLNKTRLSVAVLAALSGMNLSPVQAQTVNNDDTLEVIEVTSFRGSLIKAKDL